MQYINSEIITELSNQLDSFLPEKARRIKQKNSSDEKTDEKNDGDDKKGSGSKKRKGKEDSKKRKKQKEKPVMRDPVKLKNNVPEIEKILSVWLDLVNISTFWLNFFPRNFMLQDKDNLLG